MAFERIAVLGAGSWGTALAHAALRAGRDVMLWSRDPKAAETMAATRANPLLPGIAIDKKIAITSSLADALKADAMLAAVPAQSLRALAAGIAPSLRAGTPVISCAKGIERGTRKFMTEIIADAAPHAVPAILSGPSFADDVARGLPTAVTLAAADETIAADLAQGARLRDLPPYHSTDLARSRDRRRGQECACDRDRHRVGTRTWRERGGGAGHARLRRTGAFRPQVRRAAGNA